MVNHTYNTYILFLFLNKICKKSIILQNNNLLKIII